MQKYDVVLLIDATLSEKNRKEVVSEFEKLIKKNIVDQDDIVYMYSYYIQAEAEDLDILKKNILYNKAIKRYFIFKMDTTEAFVTFSKVNDELKTIIETWDAKKL